MNSKGITKIAQKTAAQRRKTLERVGDSPVQFSVTVKQFVSLYKAVKKEVLEVREVFESKGVEDSKIVAYLNDNYPTYILDRVILRDKIVRYISLKRHESNHSESTKTNES